MMPFTLGNKTGRRKLSGHKTPSLCDVAARRSCFGFIPLLSRLAQISETSVKAASSELKVVSVLSLLVRAGCNSNSMWKLYVSSSGSAVTCRDPPDTS